MNAENTSKIAEKVWTWVSDAANQVADWGSKEIPAFIHEYLTWKFWESAVGIIPWLVLSLIGFYIMFFVIKKNLQKIADYVTQKKDEQLLVKTIGYVVMLGIFAGICCNVPKENIMTCLQIKLAPKVYLIEKAAEIIKDAKASNQ